MTHEELEKANTVQRLIQSATWLVTNDEIQKDKFQVMFNCDKEFHEEFLQLRDKYYKKYIEQFKEL